MNSLEIAESFVRSFCKADLRSLELVLAHNFHLKGPLFEFASPSEYLASLSRNLVPDPEAEIISSFRNGNEAAVFYTYQGNTIGQLFVCNEGRVSETTLVFDTKRVT